MAAAAVCRQSPAKFRRCAVKFVPEGLGKMRVTGEAQIERKHGEIRLTVHQMLEGAAQTQTSLLLMKASPGLMSKNPREMKRGAEDGAREVGEA